MPGFPCQGGSNIVDEVLHGVIVLRNGNAATAPKLQIATPSRNAGRCSKRRRHPLARAPAVNRSDPKLARRKALPASAGFDRRDQVEREGPEVLDDVLRGQEVEELASTADYLPALAFG
jgi:hypothetical protein